MLLELCLSVVVLRTFFFNAKSHITLTVLHENFLCHTAGFSHATPLLHLRQDRPVFAAVDFETSDM